MITQLCPDRISVTVIAFNEDGRRVGESHPNARLSDETVDHIRELHEDEGMGYLAISQRLNIALTTVRKICAYQSRIQTPMRWARITPSTIAYIHRQRLEGRGMVGLSRELRIPYQMMRRMMIATKLGGVNGEQG